MPHVNQRRYVVCEECGLPVEAEKREEFHGPYAHYFHCGYAHECSALELKSKIDACYEAIARDREKNTAAQMGEKDKP